MKLDERQKRFADEYIKSGITETAAINAGYSASYARSQSYKLLANVGIKSYIDEQLKLIKKESIAEQDEILQLLTSIARGEASGMALVGSGAGAQDVLQVPPTLAERTKAAELLGKRYAMWTDKQIVEGVQQVVIHNDLES